MSTNEHSQKIHTISVYVANKPGVLARVAQVFSRRGYNIDSLVVSASADGRYSRMTIAAQGSSGGLDQIIRQVSKLIDVLHCTDHTNEACVIQELALIKIRVPADDRTQAIQVADHFKARSVDLTETSMTVMVTGGSEKLDACIGMLRKFDIIELVRTGKVLMARGDRAT